MSGLSSCARSPAPCGGRTAFSVWLRRARPADDVRPFLLRQVASPVRWTDCVQRLASEGATAFVEVGPGRVLSGLLRRIVNGARGQSIEDPAGLEKALAAARTP